MKKLNLFKLLITVLFVNCLLVTSRLQAEQAGCIKHEAHEGLTYLLVDRSDNVRHPDGVKQTILTVKESIQPGQRLVIGASTDKSSDTRILLDLVRPKKDLWESPLKTKARDKAFTECVNSVEGGLLGSKESYSHSAILETLGFVGKVVSADPAGSKRLVLQSDMVQNSEEISFFSGKTVDADATLKRVDKDGLLSDLKSVEVFVAGAGEGVPELKARQIEQFWKKYFEKSGATLKFYGPVLTGIGG